MYCCIYKGCLKAPLTPAESTCGHWRLLVSRAQGQAHAGARSTLQPSHPALCCFPPFPKASHPFCTGKRRLSAARAPKPQEASNKRLFKLDVDGKTQVIYLFPNHCYFAELRESSCPTSPLAGFYSQKPFAQLQHGSTKPRSHSGALMPEWFGTAACRAGRQQCQSPFVVPPAK